MWPHSLQHTRLLCPPGVVLRFLSAESVVLSNHLTLFFFVVQSLSHVQLFATLWTAAQQASLTFTISQSLLKLMSIESVMPSNHLALCCPLLLLPSVFPNIRSSPVSWLFTSRSQSIGASALAPGLPMNIQHWFPLGLTGLIFLQSSGLLRVFSSPTVRKHQFFGTQHSLWSIHTWPLEKPSAALTTWIFVHKVVSL